MTHLNHPPGTASLRMMALLLPAALLTVALVSAGRLEPRDSIIPAPTGYRIDINNADRAELSLLPGVGPGVAEKIIEHRGRAGPFRTASDLERVHMIGPLTRSKIEPWIIFGTLLNEADSGDPQRWFSAPHAR